MEAGLHKQIVSFLQLGILPNTFTSTKWNFQAQAQNYVVQHGCLYRQGKRVILASECATVYQELHSNVLLLTAKNFFFEKNLIFMSAFWS